MSQLTTALIKIWEDRCTGANSLTPKNTFEITNTKFRMVLNGDFSKWSELVTANGVPANAQHEKSATHLSINWSSYADEILGEGGILANALEGYQVREPQLAMARIWQRAMEMGEAAAIEAGTGTGKSFAYIIPPLVAGKKLVIYTSNKTLQMQLIKKDLPFLFSTLSGCENKKAVLVQGRNNYICMERVENVVSGHAELPTPELAAWYAEEKKQSFEQVDFQDRGNLENLPFEIELKDRQKITTDNCLRKHCPFYDRCFYYVSKEQRGSADVLVANHTLAVLNHLYPMAQIIPPVGAIVFDEAHKLPDFVRNAVGTEITYDSLRKHVDELCGHSIDNAPDLDKLCSDFRAEVEMIMRFNKVDIQIPVKSDVVFNAGKELGLLMAMAANDIWDNETIPSGPYEISLQNKAQKIRVYASHLVNFSVPPNEKSVRWITKEKEFTCVVSPWDVSQVISDMAGFVTPPAMIQTHEDAPIEPEKPTYTRCTRCHRTLTAESVYVLNGQPFGPVCIGYVDPDGDADQLKLSDWLATAELLIVSEDKPQDSQKQETKRRPYAPPVLFTSATLAAPVKAGRQLVRNLDLFLKESGIPEAFTAISESPFDYTKNALIYVPPVNNTPVPNKDKAAWEKWAIEKMAELVSYSNGGAFLLFTSYAMLNMAYDYLAKEFKRDGYLVMKQGALPKAEIVKQFKENGNAILFATQSFFEGVDIPGNALRLVVIDKLPFAAPNPLLNARGEAVKREAVAAGITNQKTLDWLPREKIGIPEMATILQQAHGRLIRTSTDRGVVALLDCRARAAWVSDYVDLAMPGRWTDAEYVVSDFFADKTTDRIFVNTLTPIQQFELIAGDIPF